MFIENLVIQGQRRYFMCPDNFIMVLNCNTKDVLYKTPLGPLLMKACKKGIHCLNFMEENIDESYSLDFTCDVTWRFDEENWIQELVGKWLSTYFRSPKDVDFIDMSHCFCFSLPEDSFYKRVYLELYKGTKFGNIISYKELASVAGNKGAVRAVGTAMAKNPIPLIIPCHRVIRSDGSFGNYSSGKRNPIKKCLLKYEEKGLKDE
ncbi:methylated-DNA--protein-cysteine methyltransferase-like isoform X2 [Artemia franciscana]|uniref:methylated-DNA--protein-cysteine methyltransferase-like isoform X2 n=1 Tax=Artemia franciscana TaxID=6661 RepID=UPI0032D9AFEE